MAHGLADQQFRSYEDIEKWLDSWIASKDEHFYRNGIRALPERWANVVANDGQHFKWFIYNNFFAIISSGESAIGTRVFGAARWLPKFTERNTLKVK